jgi:aminoglycoside N3'-acetyltransferase
MPVPTTSRVEFESHLSKLGIEKGMHLAVHSRLISFGRMEGGVETVFNSLSEAVGATGSLVFPAYTMNLTKDDIYDPATTPSHAMGGLSEYARSRSDVVRTLCPVHGHLLTGHKSEAVGAANPENSMGPDSSFEVMAENGFHLLLLGCTFHEGATSVHHAEAIKGVPYREWLELPRRVRLATGEIANLKCQYYGRKNGIPWDTDLSAVEKQAATAAICREVLVHGRTSHLMTLQDLNNCVFEMIDQNPYALMQATSDD